MHNEKGIEKKFSLSFIFLFIIMWLLFGGNTWNADYANYSRLYNDISEFSSRNTEVGFYIFSKICSLMGLSYNTFLMIYSLVGMLLIASTIKKYSNNDTLALMLIFIFPFLIDIVQIRNFMAMAILIYSIPYLVSGKLKDLLKYIFFIFLAFCFHKTALFYLILLLTKIKSIRKIIFFSFSFLIVALIGKSAIVSVFSQILNLERYGVYLSNSESPVVTFILFLYIFTNILLIGYVARKMNTNKYKEFSDSYGLRKYDQGKFANLILKINILGTISLVFISMDINFLRLFRNLIPLNLIVFTMMKPRNRFTTNLNEFVHSILFFSLIIISNIVFIVLLSYDEILYPVFVHNIIFEWLSR
ncbi:EpsG family protein [Psychrobacillus sp.]|uniref:EpsG family protein n=1 Tax=Psychrobacillus sp. TaxID=1871623 RepID=UPI0028BE6FFC|nr:EpsG family protein [Psychrobacillus sp.]